MHVQVMAYTAFGSLWINVARHDETEAGGSFYKSVYRSSRPLPDDADTLSDSQVCYELSEALRLAASDCPT
jgi:hypothetical protein